jgi:hypothetical protein
MPNASWLQALAAYLPPLPLNPSSHQMGRPPAA